MKKIMLATMIFVTGNVSAQINSEWLNINEKNLYITESIMGLNQEYPNVAVSELFAWYEDVGWVYTRGYAMNGDDRSAFVTQTGKWQVVK